MKNKGKNRGFTIIELVIGLGIGIVVLTGLMTFYFRSSKMIGEQQAVAKDATQLQFVMNKIVQDIKETNTQAPGTGSTVNYTQWGNLPYLSYLKVFNPVSVDQPLTSAYPKMIPTYPAAYLFAWQNDPLQTIGTSNRWFPKVDPNNISPNQLMFYKVVNNQVLRITYYTQPDPNFPALPIVYRLRRKQQTNISSTSLLLNDPALATNDTVILSNLNNVEFTYPILSRKLANPTDFGYVLANVDSNLRTKVTTATDPDPFKIPYVQSKFMNEYRNIINIKIVTSGPKIGNKRVNALELSTEVNIRN